MLQPSDELCYIRKSRSIDQIEQRLTLEESLRIIEDSLYESQLLDGTRRALEASAGGIRGRLLEIRRS